MATYPGFDNLPENININDEVETGGRTWRYDGTKWILVAGDITEGDSVFKAEIPIELSSSVSPDGTQNTITHFFDMQKLDKLTGN